MTRLMRLALLVCCATGAAAQNTSSRATIVAHVLDFVADVLPPATLAPFAGEMEAAMAAMAANVARDHHVPEVAAAKATLQPVLAQIERDLGAPNTTAFDYFGWVPRYEASAVAGAASQPLGANCWNTVSVTAMAPTAAGDVQVSIKVAGAKSLLCSDMYALITPAAFQLAWLPGPIGGTKHYTFSTANLTASEKWDLLNTGVRVFRFRDNPLKTVSDVLQTALLFVPLLTAKPPAFAAKRNVDFLRNYRGLTMAPRNDSGATLLDASDIDPGSFFGIIRLDGLDTMLAWGMGSHTGHTAIALHNETGHLHVCESTTKDSYWPVNGVQCTPYARWLKQAREAGHNVVLAPLAEPYRSRFNNTAALRFFRENEALDYGFQSMLWGWIDTPRDNYPCLPPYPNSDGDGFCLTFELYSTLFPFIGKLTGSAAIEQLYLAAFNQRVFNSTTAPLRSATDVYQAAAAKEMDLHAMPTIIERDDTIYNQVFNNGTKTRGLAMNCDVFVCRMWKAGGLFDALGDGFQCAELTNWDDYALEVLAAPATRPAACVAADPANKLCQLVGDWTLELPDLGTRKPLPGYAQKCPGLPPMYERPDVC